MSSPWTWHLSTQSFQSLNNDSSTLKVKQIFVPCNNPQNLIDKATADEVVKIMNIGVISLELFGFVTNLINCIVFTKQGLKDRINLCLFSLALADMSFVLLNFTAMFFSVLGLFDEELEAYWSNKYIGTVLGPKLGCMNISNLLTMIIALERCICVVSPFTAKSFLKTRYMAILIAVMAAYVLGIYSLLNLKYMTVHITDSVTNSSSWVLRLTDFYLDNKIAITILYNYLLVLAVPCLSLSVVVLCTSIIVIRLKQTATWRQQSASSNASGGSGDKREAAVTKMLTVVCFIYVGCMTPSVTQAFFRALMPGYLPSGIYCNTLNVVGAMIQVCEVTNSSVNFIVYFTMGSRFRDTVRQLFATQPHPKKSLTAAGPEL